MLDKAIKYSKKHRKTYKKKAQKADNLSVVPDKKALVIQKSSLEMVIIKK